MNSVNSQLKDQILDVFGKSLPLKQISEQLGQKRQLSIINAPATARVFTLLSLYAGAQKTFLVVLADDKSAKLFYDDLVNVAHNTAIEYFPVMHRQLWTELGPESNRVGQRLLTLKNLMSTRPGIIVTSAGALLEKVYHPQQMKNRTLCFKEGDTVNFNTIIAQLVENGFVREDRVDRPGEMSVRGGLIDLFMFEELHPVRIEFFGDTIESIRKFDIETQRSIAKCREITVYPLGAGGLYGPFDDLNMSEMTFDGCILDYLPQESNVCFIDYSMVHAGIMDFEQEMSFRLEGFAKEHKIEELPYNMFYMGYKTILKILHQMPACEFSLLNSSFAYHVDMGILPATGFYGKFNLFKDEINRFLSEHPQTPPGFYYCCDSTGQESRIKELLTQEKFPEILKTALLNISEGFCWPEKGLYIYTNRELFSREKYPKPGKIEKRQVALRDLSAIQFGDFVVHQDYGIGIYKGLKKIQAYGKERECLLIEYKDNDLLYVPLEKMDLVQKYSGRDSMIPQINKLGTAAWEKLKAKTREDIKQVAEKLIKLYATRKIRKGYAFSEDSVWQKELEVSFEYEETKDQLDAIESIKNDMEKPRPMDRLVCGDVGFGKTEVAIRAAFKAINDGKQVAVLVPTTILAQQHYLTFKSRLKQFPVTIDMLSRFKTPAQQKEIIKKLSVGKLDLLIGTHRLLSKDIIFNDLGLLVVDEEHRFGVLHKEKIKLLKATVDTLSLSATPIPRTMHMALMGAKDMSIINTPPHNRMPVKTEVARFDNDLIREIIMREVNRNGQVFFVHNRVQSIYGIAHHVREIVPEIKIAVAHGQMKAHELEDVMQNFAMGKIQCLVCTMIIESGIDMPNANTLIINRADKFGLAQLYQLRGRVGRSDHQAYAYLLVPPLRKLSRTAIKRLQTIQEMSALGSGYKVAMRDLEIRGTGNVFGPQQSGFIDALGYDLYTKIINEAISELKAELNIGKVEKPVAKKFEPQIDIKVDAYLPEKYIRNASERVDIYRRLIEAGSIEKIQDLKKELIDRFGELPEEAEMLFDYVQIKALAEKALVSKLVVSDTKIIGQFAGDYIPRGEQFKEWFGKMVRNAKEKFELKQQNDLLFFEIKTSRSEKQITTAKYFLQSIV